MAELPGEPAWASRYEQLRHSAVNGTEAAGCGWGLALMMRHGLVAWMRAWPRRGDARPRRERMARPTTPVADAGSLVAVLANMIFSARQEVVA